MENMQYAEELLREFLVFRGFTNTLQAFEKELGSDIGKGFQVDRLLDLIFSVYIPKCQAANLVNLLHFFKQCFGSYEIELMSSLSKLEVSIMRYYIIHALQSGKREKVIEFFDTHGSELVQKHQDWALWFAIPYHKSPHLDPEFRLYFSKEWINTLQLSVRNFLSKMLHDTRIPALLKISSEHNTVNRLKGDIKQLNLKVSQLQALLEEKEVQLCQARSGKRDSFQYIDDRSGAGSQDLKSCVSKSEKSGLFQNVQGEDSVVNIDDTRGEMQREEEFPEVRVDYQETFLGHTSPITQCRFSASGDNIASASVDGTVRIWTYESSASTSRNATIYCGAEVMSLEWDSKSDRLLLIGTADGGIKAWNVDAKRVVCDLKCTKEFTSVLDLKCSPVEPIFVSAAASTRPDAMYFDKLGHASLTVWNMRTWKAMTVLPLGEDPPAITSLCFNHNGKLLAAAAKDGMIHMFDMSAGQQITGWPAHDFPISSVLFGSDETSIFTLGADGKIFEWSLQNQGEVLWSSNCSRFCNIQSDIMYKQEMALDANGNQLLLSSNSLRAPIYKVRGRMGGMTTLPHSGSITTVDWHPTLPLLLTGSVDQSVRITSIL
ncbi:unnamed protein product [Cuscuta epithymum]|uniref:WD repeat-containing protein 91 homolog n=1 Tax=Cuscuta epithymum TaxID=186058 RepID=A0AAV0CAY0_9ASTE|nr:unnamed protein product [Cuscuta epithymum]